MTGQCRVDGCETALDQHSAKGMCGRHYRKLKLYGDPLADRRRVIHTCSVDGCGQPAHAKRVCVAHYGRLTRYGDTLADVPIVARQCLRPTEARFWAKVDRSGGPEACWPWTGARAWNGYGQFGDGGQIHIASRVAWELSCGPIAEGLHVLHRCDNPPCVNPAHLFLGTHSDNMRDMVAKGRLPAHMRPRSPESEAVAS